MSLLKDSLKCGVSALALLSFLQGSVHAQQSSTSTLINQTLQQATGWSGAFSDPPPMNPDPGNSYNTNPVGYEFLPLSATAANTIQSMAAQAGVGSSGSATQQRAENTLNSITVSLATSNNVVRQGVQNSLTPGDYHTLTQFLSSAPQNVMSATNATTAGYTTQSDLFSSPTSASSSTGAAAIVTGVGSGQSASNTVNTFNAKMTENASLVLQQTNRTAVSSGLFDTVQRAVNSADAASYNTPSPGATTVVSSLQQASHTGSNAAVLSGPGDLSLSGEQSNVFDTAATSEYKTQQQIGNIATAVSVGATPVTSAAGIHSSNAALGSGVSRIDNVSQKTAVTNNTLVSSQSLAIAPGVAFDQTFNDRAVETSVAQNNSGGLVGAQTAKNVLYAMTGHGAASILGAEAQTRQDASFAANTVTTSGQLSGEVKQTGIIINSSAAGSSENISLSHSETGSASVSNIQQNGIQTLNSAAAANMAGAALRQNSVASITTANDIYANSNPANAQYLGPRTSATVSGTSQSLQVISNSVSANTISGGGMTQQGTTEPGAGTGGIVLSNNLGVSSSQNALARAQGVTQALGSTVNSIATPYLNSSINQSVGSGNQSTTGSILVSGGSAVAVASNQSATNVANIVGSK